MPPIVIGNKPYNKLKLDNLLDSFHSNIRCNMGIPKENNGSIKDQLALCSHVFDNFIKQKASWETVFKVYGEEYKQEHLRYFYDNFSEKDYNSVWYADASYVNDRYNNFLKSIKCPYMFKKQPRTGFVCLLELILNNVKPFVFGFSVANETRKSYYINDFVFKREDENTSCHSKQDELPILRFLHQKNFIDATLCMLKDEDIPTLECNDLQPSSFIVNTLDKIYGQVIIK